ncbi:hypothetical protein V8C86DRAFT_2446883 [Haematococcus lacustris]
MPTAEYLHDYRAVFTCILLSIHMSTEQYLNDYRAVSTCLLSSIHITAEQYPHGSRAGQVHLVAEQVTCVSVHHETNKLGTLVGCRLYLQELERGRSFRDAEFWVERLMQYVKLWAGKHSPGCSKGLISCLRDQVHRGVKRFAAMRPDAAEAEEQQVAPKRARLVGPGRDPISVTDAQVLERQQCQLVGAGLLRCPVPNSEERVRQACCITVGEMNRGRGQHSGWELPDVNAIFPTAPTVPGEAAVPSARPGLVRYYTRAVCTQQKMNSVAYKRAVRRPSTWVLAQYFDGGSTEKINKYAAHIEFWVRLEHPNHPGHFLRLAIARLVRLHPVRGLPELLHGVGDPKPEPVPEDEPEPEPDSQQLDVAGTSGTAVAMPIQGAGGVQFGGPDAAQGGHRRSSRLASQQAAPVPRPAAPTQAAPAPKRKKPVSDVNPDQWYGIDGELLHTMLVCAFPDGEGVGDMYFVPYNSLSKA